MKASAVLGTALDGAYLMRGLVGINQSENEIGNLSEGLKRRLAVVRTWHSLTYSFSIKFLIKDGDSE